ncbi:acyltransferase domain-containing protein [Actinoplanes couchii]|nr:acyltransferase domain-containing protein [Actinoplanes couchii]
MAEGTGVLVLKRHADALRAGDRVYALVRGVGVASDGRAASLVSPSADGQVLAVRRAWEAAGLDPAAPDSVGLIEAHGTATPVGDTAELTTLARAFGTGGPTIGLGTVKSMIGHAMPAAGMAGLIKAALAVHNGILPPTLHVDEPHPALASTRCLPIHRATPWPADSPRRAGVNAFGFGGINAHVVLEHPGSGPGGTPTFAAGAPVISSGHPAPSSASATQGRVLAAPAAAVLPAETGAALPARGSAPADPFRIPPPPAALITPAPAAVPSARPAPAAVSSTHPVSLAVPSTHPASAAVLFTQPVPTAVSVTGAGGDFVEPLLLLAADSREALTDRLAISDEELLARSAAGDFLRGDFSADTEPGSCRLAIVAPTPRRLALARKVIERGRPWRGREDIWFTTEPLLTGDGTLAFLFPGFEPEFAPRLDEVAAHLGLAGPRLTGGTELHSRGADVVAVGRFLAEALSELGVVPDLVSGHSLGEWTAMVAAGSYRAADVDSFVASLRPGTVPVPEVDYAAVGCGADRALSIAAAPGVVISHDNCPHQSVLCGPPAAITAALERLRAEGVPGEVLAFRSGFHTPMATPFLAAVRASFDMLPLDPPHTPVWSATTLAPYPQEPADVRQLLVRHLLEPVRFRQLLERLHDRGVRGFVQVGPGSLTGFVADTLGRQDHLTIAAHTPSRGGTAQLRRVAAALWTEGRTPDWSRLPTPARSTAASTQVPAPPAEPPAERHLTEVREQPNEPNTERARAKAKEGSGLKGGTPVRLALGAPQVQLAGTIPPLIPAVPAANGVPLPIAAGLLPTDGVPLPIAAGLLPTDGLPLSAAAALLPTDGASLSTAAGLPPVADGPLLTAGAALPTIGAALPASGVPLQAAGVPFPATDSPILAALAATLAETSAAAREVAEAWFAASIANPAQVPPSSSQIPAKAGQIPVQAGQIPARSPLEPTRQVSPAGVGGVRTVECSLGGMPWLTDHSLIPQAAGWAEPSDRFPVVPLTGLLELMGEAAREISPGLIVVGLEQVRVRRWLVVDPPTTVTVRAVSAGAGKVKVSIDGYASGTVLVASGYPVPPPVDNGALREERPAPVDAVRLYVDNWMFHGPEFAGVSRLDVLAADGIRGELTALPAPGALLDAAGQLIGHWMQVSADVDQVVFPIGIAGVHWFGPPPEPGERLQCTARVTELTDDRMRADAQLIGADGRVRVTITDWVTHRFSTDDRMWQLKQHPGTVGAGEPQPDGWCLVRERWPDTATRELVMRRYLVAAERAEYADRNPMAQRAWLLGRVAAKDAVRELFRRRGVKELFPCEIRVGNDPGGRPWARGPAGELFHISLAHSGPIAVAIAVEHASRPTAGREGVDVGVVPTAGREGVDVGVEPTAGREGVDIGVEPVAERESVGIDVEPVAERAIADVALTEAEKRLFEQTDPVDRAELLTRLWTAKEATAKAAGTGLEGNPRRFAAGELTADGCIVTADGHRWTIRHRAIEVSGRRYVVAWTTEPPRKAGTAEASSRAGTPEPPDGAWMAEPPDGAWMAEPPDGAWTAEASDGAWMAEPPGEVGMGELLNRGWAAGAARAGGMAGALGDGPGTELPSQGGNA